MKKNTVFFLLIITILCISGVKFSYTSPDSNTGATGVYCTSCHADYLLNAAGGNVSLLGLPIGNYNPNTTYNLSLAINHFTNDRERWGFAIKAIDSAGNTIGTFSSSNSNVIVNGDELSHFYAVRTNPQNNFTYDSLKWTAPATVGSATFYYVGNAANNSSGNDGDYIYSGVTTITLPMNLKNFSAKIIDKNVLLVWESMTNKNATFFEIERSDDGQFFFSIGTIKANNNTRILTYNFIDKNVTSNNSSSIFYRLKSIERNSEVHYSATASVQVKNTSLVIKNVYPTMVKQNENINVKIVSHQNNQMKILLMDANGNVLQNNEFSLTKGLNKIQLRLYKNYSAGVKFLRFVSTNFTETKSIVFVK